MRILPLLLALVPLAASSEESAFRLHQDLVRQGFVVQGADDGRFEAARGKALAVTLDSNAPASRLLAPLGFELDGTTSFTLEVELTIDALAGGPDDFFQLAFGLASSATTGLNRTGTALPAPPWFVDDSDVWDSVEIAYFPNETFFGGPFLQPTVFGGATGSPFANFAANFGPSADLGDNSGDAVRALPLGAPLRLELRHDACLQLLTTRVHVLEGGRARELVTGLEPVDLSAVNATSTFRVDSFAIHAYRDLADFDPSTPSLEGRVRFHEARVVRHDGPVARVVPEPGGRGGALVRVLGWVNAPAPGDEVELAVVETGEPVVARGAGGGEAKLRIARSTLAAGATLDLLGCAVPVQP